MKFVRRDCTLLLYFTCYLNRTLLITLSRLYSTRLTRESVCISMCKGGLAGQLVLMNECTSN